MFDRKNIQTIYIYSTKSFSSGIMALLNSSALADDDIKKTGKYTILLKKTTYDEIKQAIDKNQNIPYQSLRKRKQKKLHNLKFKPKQTEQFKATEKENAPTESFNSKMPMKSIVKKRSSKTNL